MKLSSLVRVTILALAAGCTPRAPVSPPHSDAAPPHVATPRSAGALLAAPAPPLSVDRIDAAGAVTVAKGRVTLVIFTGSWSEGSKRALHALADLHRSAPELDVAAISMDEDAELGRAFARSCGATFPVGHDPRGAKAAGAWGQSPFLPNTVFLVDRRGVVRYVGRGGKDGWLPEVASELPVEVAHLLAER